MNENIAALMVLVGLVLLLGVWAGWHIGWCRGYSAGCVRGRELIGQILNPLPRNVNSRCVAPEESKNVSQTK